MLMFEKFSMESFTSFMRDASGGHCLTTCLRGQPFPIIFGNGKEKASYPKSNKYYDRASEKNKDETLNPAPPLWIPSR
jgi:hypothetical protein